VLTNACTYIQVIAPVGIFLLVTAMTMERPKRNLKPGSRQGSNGSTKNRPPKFGRCTSVYLSPLFSEEYRQLCEEHYGVSGSFRLNELMLADLADMKGQTLPSQTNITALEMQVANLIARTKKVKSFLTKLGVYSDLEDLTIKWRLDVESFGNTDSIIDKLLSYRLLPTDHFTKDDIELFVQLLSLVKEKTLKKAELDKLRLNRIRGTPAPVPLGSSPEPVTVRLMRLFRSPSLQFRLRLRIRNLSLRMRLRRDPRATWIESPSCWNPLRVKIKLW